MWVVLSVFDKKAEVYGGVYLARSIAVGARMFTDTILSGPDTVIRQHPEDFVLCQVGTFDDVTGELFGGGPVRLLEAKEVSYAAVV